MINVSDNDECHFAGTTAEWHYGKQRLKKCVLRRLRKTARDGADVTWCGKPFQTSTSISSRISSKWYKRKIHHIPLTAHLPLQGIEPVGGEP